MLKESPKNVEVRFIKGNLLLQKRDGLNAVNEFRTVVSEKPQFIEGYLRLAEAYLLQKDPRLALDTLKNAEKLEPASREVQIALARYYGTQRDLKAAQQVLAKILNTTPGDIEVRVEMGDLLCANGEEGKGGAEAVEGAWSLNRGFVTLAEDYIKHDIYIMKIVERFDPELQARFGPGYEKLRDVWNDEEERI